MDDEDFAIPFNLVTGHEYQGKNITRLLTAEIEHSYTAGGGWAGFAQWLTAGRVVRKGEHGTACMTVIEVDKGEDGTGTRKPRGFRVFHYDQTEELEDRDSVTGETLSGQPNDDALAV